MKRIALLSIFFLVFFSCQPKENTSTESNSISQKRLAVESVDAIQFKKLSEQEDVIILDVRTSQEVALGKIPNAIVIDIYDPEFGAKVVQLPQEKSILIYCSAGVRSAKAADFLIANGYSSVYHLEGGLGNWYENSFPLEK